MEQLPLRAIDGQHPVPSDLLDAVGPKPDQQLSAGALGRRQ